MEGAAPHGYVRVGDILASGLGKRGRHGGGQGPFIAVGKGRSLPLGVEDDGRGAKCMDACMMEGGTPAERLHKRVGPPWRGPGGTSLTVPLLAFPWLALPLPLRATVAAL
ncbi:hypothetical protein BN1708_000566, partial [Verticillium longisporum]